MLIWPLFADPDNPCLNAAGTPPSGCATSVSEVNKSSNLAAQIVRNTNLSQYLFPTNLIKGGAKMTADFYCSLYTKVNKSCEL